MPSKDQITTEKLRAVVDLTEIAKELSRLGKRYNTYQDLFNSADRAVMDIARKIAES